MHKYLDTPTDVAFAKLFLDPNNPRTAPEERPGYEDPDLIFDTAVQTPLSARLEDAREIDELEANIISQGWTPIDPILVWEHPDKAKHYVVIEGNTRTLVLRRIRAKLAKERKHLEAMEKKPKSYDKQELLDQRAYVAQLQEIVDDTENLHTHRIKAKTADDLEQALPHLHAVRHIGHAQPWSPYGLNLYILTRYRQMFEDKHGDKAPLKIEEPLVKELAATVSLKPTKVRRNIQAAAAFSHFRRNFEHKLPPTGKLTDEDQYFFELLLQNDYPGEKFGFDKTDLHLSPELEEVLFKWAFALPRPEGKDNPNKFYKAENIRLWQQLHKYDVANSTNFAKQFDVTDPDSAPPMTKVEAEYMQHKAKVSPLFTIDTLVNNLKTLPVDTLRSQASTLEPMIKEMIKTGNTFLKLIKVVEAEEA